MAAFDMKRPNLVREWLRDKIIRWKAFLDEKIEKARALGLLNNLEVDPEEITAKTINLVPT
jgi:hypothetical protein